MNYQVSIEGGFNVLTGDVVSEIAPFSGMPVTLTFNGTDYDLQIATYTPHQTPFREPVERLRYYAPVRRRQRMTLRQPARPLL